MRAYLIVQRSTSPMGPISTTPGCPRSFAPSTVSETRGPALIGGIPTKRHNCVSFLAGQPVEGNDVCRVLAEVAVPHPGRHHAEVDQTFYGLARSEIVGIDPGVGISYTLQVLTCGLVRQAFNLNSLVIVPSDRNRRPGVASEIDKLARGIRRIEHHLEATVPRGTNSPLL